jgi:hypothetical protein
MLDALEAEIEILTLDTVLSKEQEEMLDALRKGAVLHVADATGEATVQALDDLSPEIRACIRSGTEHRLQCPSCLENKVQDVRMDAAAWLLDGKDEQARLLLEDAEQLQRRVAELRKQHTAPDNYKESAS